MIKRIIFLAITAVCAVVAIAQSRQVAVLNHEGQYSTFYGPNGLKNAIDEAVDGDVITLSPGHFSDVNIRQTISVRGVRMSDDITKSTRIDDIRIVTDSGKVNIENIVITSLLHVYRASEINVTKCWLNGLSSEHLGVANFTNVELLDWGNNNGGWVAETTNMINCVVRNCNPWTRWYGYCSYINCVFDVPLGLGVYKNCIFLDGDYLNKLCTASGCKYVGTVDDFFKYVGGDNECAPIGTQVFKENSFYELTPEYAAKWLGNDGTQAGIYGGPKPFTTEPSHPYISKFEIDDETTTDGKLNISVEITTPAK
ncbi:MAG: hypothetical protein NC453_28200 [Muribaculum sp.]|nr:hypothetical protein [Muribaculum sp.]